MSPLDIAFNIISFALSVIGAVFVFAWALAIIAWSFTWLSILWMKRTDPAAYERFRILHNLRKGAWKRR